MQKLKKGIANYKHVKLLNLVNSDINHKSFLARKFYKKSKNLYPIDHKKSIFIFNSMLFAKKIPLKHKYLPIHAKAPLLYAKSSKNFVTQQSIECFNSHNALFMFMLEKRTYKKQNSLRELTTFVQKRPSNRIENLSLLHGSFVKNMFCQNKSPMSVLYASSRQYITKKNKKRAIIVEAQLSEQSCRNKAVRGKLKEQSSLPEHWIDLYDPCKTSFCKDRPFSQLAHTQKLEILYPTNLDKMSFLFTDIANLALSLSTYTFLKQNNIHKVGNLLEYSPKNLYLFLNKNREMFVELKICLLLLGFWQKDLLE